MPVNRLLIANILEYYLRVLTAGLLMLQAVSANAAMRELHVDQVRKDLGAEAVRISVIEPHMQCGEADCKVTYVGIPLGKVMQYYFPDTWEGFNGIIHFYASDGYLAAIDTNRVRKQDAYLTFERADGRPFVVDNQQQNEKNLPLGPFYLVWDNLGIRNYRSRVAMDGPIRWYVLNCCRPRSMTSCCRPTHLPRFGKVSGTGKSTAWVVTRSMV